VRDDETSAETSLKQLVAQADVIPIVRGVGITSVTSHRHTEVKEHLLRQRQGVPFEVERTLCAACRKVLAERPLRRAAA
jgi:NMD protein affecting ribosome stability and mRNA decay